jgi:hypothetical protein
VDARRSLFVPARRKSLLQLDRLARRISEPLGHTRLGQRFARPLSSRTFTMPIETWTMTGADEVVAGDPATSSETASANLVSTTLLK